MQLLCNGTSMLVLHHCVLQLACQEAMADNAVPAARAALLKLLHVLQQQQQNVGATDTEGTKAGGSSSQVPESWVLRALVKLDSEVSLSSFSSRHPVTDWFIDCQVLVKLVSYWKLDPFASNACALCLLLPILRSWTGIARSTLHRRQPPLPLRQQPWMPRQQRQQQQMQASALAQVSNIQLLPRPSWSLPRSQHRMTASLATMLLAWQQQQPPQPPRRPPGAIHVDALSKLLR
jgi:hypothetical protein